jgi:sec-independent protein translocase protein TatB
MLRRDGRIVTAMYGKVSLQLMGTPPIQMANLGMADSLILMVMALVVFGPRRLPQIGRQIGKLMYEFRKASNDFKFQMEEELRSAEDADRRKKEEERLRALAAPAPPALPVEAPTTAAIENPHPGQGVYSPAITAAPESPAEDTYRRIQPPSTGEQIAAARPNSLTALAQAPGESGAAANVDAESPTPESGAVEVMVSEGAPAQPGASDPEQNSRLPEQATHHG